MEKIILSPSKYVQGSGVLNNMAKYTSNLGKKVLVIASESVLGLVKEDIQKNFSEIKLNRKKSEICTQVILNHSFLINRGHIKSK